MAIKTIQVYGERNSGTNYLTKLIQSNFKGVSITNDFGWKHGDLGETMNFYDAKDKLVIPKVKKATKSSTKDVLFIVIVRNPFTWLQSMQRSPHHAPKSWFINMHEFLHTPWESYYSRPGQPSSQDAAYRNACIKKENLHERFKNPMKLRSAKLKKHLSFSKHVSNVCYINYEDLMARKSTVMQDIARVYGIETTANFKDITEDKFGDKTYKPKKYASIQASDLHFVLDQLNHETEEKVGYLINESSLARLAGKSLFAKWLKAKNLIKRPEKLIDHDFRPSFYKNGKRVMNGRN